MKRFVEGIDRGQSTLFPECLEDWICEDNPIRVIDAFVEKLDLAELKFCGVDPRWNYCVEAHDRRHTDNTGVSHALGHHDCPECDAGKNVRQQPFASIARNPIEDRHQSMSHRFNVGVCHSPTRRASTTKSMHLARTEILIEITAA